MIHSCVLPKPFDFVVRIDIKGHKDKTRKKISLPTDSLLSVYTMVGRSNL